MRLRYEGNRKILHRVLLKCALQGLTLSTPEDVAKVQSALNKAMAEQQRGRVA